MKRSREVNRDLEYIAEKRQKATREYEAQIADLDNTLNLLIVAEEAAKAANAADEAAAAAAKAADEAMVYVLK